MAHPGKGLLDSYSLVQFAKKFEKNGTLNPKASAL